MNSTKLELDKCMLEMRVKALEEVVQDQSDALRESSKLLQKTRLTRPAIPTERRMKIAADQRWRCADPYG